MAKYKFGFIGTGNMGAALARSVAKTIPGDQIILSNRTAKKAQTLSRELDCTAADNLTVAAQAEYIFLGVKPQMMNEMLVSISSVLADRTDRFVLVPMAAGLKISQYQQCLGAKYPIIRIMPNTPATIGEGIVLYAPSDEVFMDEITDFCEALKPAGTVDRIAEHLIDAAAAVSGCGPAFVYMFCEAISDAAVECGLPRIKANEYAALTVSGAARMITASGRHTGQLKDDVCSPGGTTIAGVHALENAGFRGAVMDAVKASFDKTSKL